MIPVFPQFKHVDLSDREDVEAFTRQFDPYSDFNFTSLWAWDTADERGISTLNGNLVVRFTDYSTHEPFFSFLGQQATEQTARTLIAYATSEGITHQLRLIPEISTVGMRASVVTIVADRDNGDYVYDVLSTARLSGGNYSGIRKSVGRFWRDNVDANFRIIDLADASAQESVLNILLAWIQRKETKHAPTDSEHERMAIARIMQTASTHSLFATGLFIRDQLIAFSIEELLPNDWIIGHFWKADMAYKGVYEALLHEKAKHFETLEKQLWNYEQDLGIQSLRQSKLSYRPMKILNKYTIVVNNR